MRCQIRGRTAVVRRAPRPSQRLVLPVLVTIAAVTVGAAAAAAPPRFVLDLAGNGTLPGEFADAEAGAAGGRETLRWQSPLFGAPFEFRLDAISGVRGQTAPPNQAATGFRCRLRGGDIIDGGLEAVDADHVVIAPFAGRPPVKIDRGLVLSLAPRDVVGGSGYIGPGGLTGWQQEPADSWRDEAARLVCNRGAAGIWRDVGGPPRARYDLVLSWRKQPEFVVSVGAAEGKRDDPFRFELIEVGPGDWTGMIARQERARGGLEEVKLPPVAKGRLRLSLFVDQQTGRLAAAVGGGERVVEMTVKPDEGRAPSGLFRLTLLAGDICLESLRVTEWTEAEPLFDERRGSAVTTRAGRVIAGDVASFDAAANEFVVATAGEPERVAAAELRAIEFAAAREPAGGGPEPVPAIRLVGHGGSVVSGELVAVTDGLILVERPGITGTIPMPLTDLLSLVSLRSAAPPPLPGRAGTLLLEGVRLPGCLVDAAAWGGGLGWQPTGSLTAAGFTAAADRLAEVEYVPGSTAGRDRKAPPRAGGAAEQVEVGGIGGAINQDDEGFFVVTMLSEEGAAARDGRIEPGDRILAIRPTQDGPFVETKGLELAGIMNLLRGRVGSKVAVRMQAEDGGKPRTIELVRGLIYVADRSILDEALAAHARVAAGQAVVAGEAAGFPAVAVLRSGDSVAARVERIDADGVRLFSPVTASAGREPVTVSQTLMKAVDLEPAAATRKISPAVFERLLTLPRGQQDRPPTHLVRLQNGDYLRGRLESLDDREVRLELLGQTKRLPRDSVVRVIWLHPEDLGPRGGADEAPAAGEPEVAEPAEMVVQGVTAAGERTTIMAERVEGSVIIGRSQAFGESRLDTNRVDRLLLGSGIGDADGELPFAQWRLRLAPLPRALRTAE
jgi:hypothetical protein